MSEYDTIAGHMWENAHNKCMLEVEVKIKRPHLVKNNSSFSETMPRPIQLVIWSLN